MFSKRRLLFALTCGIGALALPPGDADACGFKVSGALGAVRFDNVNRTPNPMNILFFRNGDSDSATKVMTPTLERVLAKVGHHTKIVSSQGEFARYIRRGEWPCEVHKTHKVHALVMDVEDAAKPEYARLNGKTNPTVIPIVKGKSQYSRARRQAYPVILTPSARPSSHLPAIEKVARVMRKRGVDLPTVATVAEREAAAAKDDRDPIKTSDDGRPVVRSGPDDDTAGRAPVRTGAGELEDGTPAALARTDEPERQPEPVKKPEPKPEPVKKPEPKPEPKPVAKPEPKPEPKPKMGDGGSIAAARAPAMKDSERTPINTNRKMEIPQDEAPPAAPKRMTFFFRTNSKVVSGRDKRKLRKHLRWLKKNPDGKLTLRAHTDAYGPSEYNLSLSQRRGDAVVEYFTKNGIAEDRLRLQALGEEDPPFEPKTNGRNRCVQVVPE